MEDLGVTASVSMSTENVERAFDRVGDKAAQMANKVAKEAEKAGAATDNMGAGAEKSAEKFTRAESRMRSAIQKSTRELEMLGKTASQKFEAQLEFKGLDKAKFQPFLDELRKAEEATKKAESGLSGLGSAAQAAGRAMAVAFSGAAAFGVVGKLVEVQREFDVLNSSLKTVTGSSAAAERELSWLKTFAKETPFGLAQATQGFVKMKALGLDPTRAALTSFGNTASAMGKDLNQMIEAVADASTGEFERLKEFGIKAKKEGDNVSLTFQGVTTTIKNSAEEITKYLENIGNNQFGGAMAERAKTLDGAIAELGDTWDELFRTINERNAGTLIYDSIKLANGAIEDATTIIKAMTAAYDDSGRATGALTTFQEGVATVFETVAVLGANLKYVITQVGVEIGGLAAQVAQAAQFNFAGVAAIREQMVADAEEARKQIDLTEKRILGARKAQEEYARYATRNASAATDPRRIDLGASSAPAAATRAGTRATKEALSEYDKLMQRLGVDLPKAAAAAEAAQHGYNKAQEEFIALAGSAVWAGFTNQQRAQVAALFENRIASEQAADAAKTLAKANLDAAASREKYLVSLSTGLDKIKADTAAQLEATARLGLSKEAIAELDAAKLEMLATDLELQAIKAMDRNLDEQTYNALKQQAEAYRELAAAKKAGATKEMALDLEKANREAAKKAADEWERAAADIERALTDGLMRGFESGKGFAENLRDTIVNMFKTMVLRPIISAIIAPISGAISGAVGSVMGGSSGGGAIGTIANGASLASNAYGLYSQGLGGTAIGQFYSGYTGATLAPGMMGPSATPITMWSQGGNVLGGAGSGAAGGGAGSGMGAFGVYAVVAALIANAFGAFKERKQVDSGLVGTLGKGDLTNYALWRESGSLFGGPEYSMMNPAQLISDKEAQLARMRESGTAAGPEMYTLEQEIKNLKEIYAGIIASTKVQSDSIQAAYGLLRTNVGDMADVLGLSSDAVRNFTMALDTGVINGDTGQRGLQLGGLTDEQVAAKINEALATANNTLAEQVIGSWVPFTETISRTVDNIVGTGENAEHVFDTITETTSGMRYVASEYARDGEKAIDTLTRLSTSLKTVNQIWDTLGYTMLDASLAGGDFASSLVDAFGGLEAMVSKFDSYYQNFYTETERRDKSREQLQTQLSDLGMGNVNFDDPNARAEYRKAVDEAIARASAQDANRRALSEALSGIDLQSVTTGVLGDVLAGLGGQGDATPEALAGLAASLTELGASATGLGDFQQAISDYIATNAEALGIEDDAAATAAALIELSGAFAAVTQASEDSTAAAERQAEAERQAAEKAQSQAFRNLQEAYAREQKVLEARLDGLEQYRAYVEKQQSLQQESLDLITGVFDVLHSSVLDLYGSVSSTAAMQAEQGRNFIEQALGTALRTGYLPDQGQLSEAIQAARAGIDSGVYANTTEQDFAKLVLAGQLRALEEVAGKQKTDAEKQLDALQKQLDSIDEQTAAINKQIELQQEVLDYWQEQIDIANGVYDATLSVEQAISALAKSLGVELTTNTKQPYLEGSKAPRPSADSGAAFGGGGSSGAQAPARYSRLVYGGTAGVGYEGIRDQSLIDRLDALSPVYHRFDGTGDLTGLAAAMKAAGGTIADLSILSGNYESDWRKAFEGVGIPAFAVGTNYVPRDMLAQIHEGEAIVPKAFNPWAGGAASGGNAEVVVELRATRAELLEMRKQLDDLNYQSKRTADATNGQGEAPMLTEAT